MLLQTQAHTLGTCACYAMLQLLILTREDGATQKQTWLCCHYPPAQLMPCNQPSSMDTCDKTLGQYKTCSVSTQHRSWKALLITTLIPRSSLQSKIQIQSHTPAAMPKALSYLVLDQAVSRRSVTCPFMNRGSTQHLMVSSLLLLFLCTLHIHTWGLGLPLGLEAPVMTPDGVKFCFLFFYIPDVLWLWMAAAALAMC